MSKSQTQDKRDLYAEVTDAIIRKLEEGTVPWHQPWNATDGLPRSISTGKAYRGINPFWLSITAMEKGYRSPFWGTFKAIQTVGGKVRKGERATPVVFWKMVRVKLSAQEAAETGKTHKTLPILRYFNVFNAEQADDMPEKYLASDADPDGFDPVAEAELIVKGYADGPQVHHGGNRAYYRPSADHIGMPEPDAFDSAEHYYSTLFHEMTHSTGHEKRLARPTLMESHSFGDESYSKEELVAEMGAAMLSGHAGIVQRTIDESAAYLAGWLKVLKADKKLLIGAAGQAQRAADHILGVSYSADDDE